MVSRSYKNILLSTVILGTSFAAAVGTSASVFATDPEAEFSITVNPSLTLALSSNAVNFSITPTVQGAYNSASFTVTSATNNVYGYTLVMGTSNVNLTSDTINLVTTEYPTIPTLAETQDGISAADFEASTDSAILNHYGIAIGTGNNFNAMKATKQVKKTTAHNTSGADNTTITIASKLDLNTAPGTYSTTLNFQITANPLSGGLEEAYQNAGKSKATINGKQYYAMQDMTSTICNNVTVTGDVIEVYDKRDNTIYHIGKLADNKCWLLDNLALDLTDSTILNNLTADNTNADATALGYLKGTTTRNPETDPYGNYATAGVANWTGNPSYHAPLIYISNKDVVSSDVSDTAGGWKAGGYYNYCAASAGSYCYGRKSDEGWWSIPGTEYLADVGDAEYDICPSGWRMPTGGIYGEYHALAKAITGYNSFDGYYFDDRIRTALRLPLAGYVYSGHVQNSGESSSFLSSTTFYDYDDDYDGNDYSYMYALLIVSHGMNSTQITSQDYDDREYGLSVRCVAW